MSKRSSLLLVVVLALFAAIGLAEGVSRQEALRRDRHLREPSIRSTVAAA